MRRAHTRRRSHTRRGQLRADRGGWGPQLLLEDLKTLRADDLALRHDVAYRAVQAAHAPAPDAPSGGRRDR